MSHLFNQTTTVTPVNPQLSRTLLPSHRINNRTGRGDKESSETDSVIYARSFISRRSFRVMTPSDASQNAKLGAYQDTPEARTPDIESAGSPPREVSTDRNDRRLWPRTVESRSTHLSDTFASNGVGQTLPKWTSTGSGSTVQSQNEPHSKCS